MKSYEIIDKLTATPSTNEKKKILSELKDEPGNNICSRIKYIFLWTYTPKLNYYIKKIDPSKIVESGENLDFDEVDQEDSTILTELLESLSEREVTGKEAIKEVHETLGRFNQPSRDLITKILLRDLRCNATDSIVNKVWPNWIPTFEVQLANTFDPEKPKEDFYYASSKMDGLRGVYIHGEGLFTRQGKKILGFENTIEKEMAILTSENHYSLDGELFSSDIPFEQIQSAVMGNKKLEDGIKEKIFFKTFAAVKDFWKQETFDSTVDMLDFLMGVDRMITREHFRFIAVTPQYLIPVTEVDKHHDEMVKKGFEGIMLRHPSTSYEFKRGNGLLKYKKFFESDFKVVAQVEGNGKYKGMLGALKVEGEIAGQKIVSEVGSGFDDAQREEFFQNSLVGKTVEIKYQGTTPDGSLRFPVFNKIKLDR